MTRFSQAALTVSDFVDQIGQSAFFTSIHPIMQYKYMLGHQKTLTFIILMESATTYALTEEKMNPFIDFEQKSRETSHHAFSEQHHYDNYLDCSHRPNRLSNHLQKGGK